MMIRVAGIVPESTVDGPGLRYTIFVQGCDIGCKGCHNRHTLDKTGGELMHVETIVDEIRLNPLLSGITLSGGEPSLQASALLPLVEEVKRMSLSVVLYSGNTLETLQMKGDPDIDRLLALTDILIDGPFIEALKDETLPFRGSRNQRILNLRKL